MDFKDLFDDLPLWATVLVCIAIIIFALALAFGILCLEGWLLMLLWNAVIPAIFIGAPTLHFWGAVGLILICNILFKSVGAIRNSKKED